MFIFFEHVVCGHLLSCLLELLLFSQWFFKTNSFPLLGLCYHVLWRVTFLVLLSAVILNSKATLAV